MTGPGFGVAVLVLLSLTAQAAAGKGEKQPQIGHTTAQQAMHKMQRRHLRKKQKQE